MAFAWLAFFGGTGEGIIYGWHGFDFALAGDIFALELGLGISVALGFIGDSGRAQRF